MRTSTIATSGLWALTLRSRSSASPAWPTTSIPASSSSRATPARSRTESSASTTRTGPSRRTTVPLPGRAVDLEPPVERRQAVGQPAQPRPGRRVGAADAVVAHLDQREAVLAADRDLRVRGLRVLRDVRQRLGDDEVGGRLDRVGQPVGRDLLDARPAAARGRRATRAPPAGRGRSAPPGGCRAPARAGRRAPRAPRPARPRAARRRTRPAIPALELRGDHAELQRERHEPLLRAVVEVALEPPPLGQPRARRAARASAAAPRPARAAPRRAARSRARAPPPRRSRGRARGRPRRAPGRGRARRRGAPRSSTSVTPCSGSSSGRPSASTYVPRSGSQYAMRSDGSPSASRSASRSRPRPGASPSALEHVAERARPATTASARARRGRRTGAR